MSSSTVYPFIYEDEPPVGAKANDTFSKDAVKAAMNASSHFNGDRRRSENLATRTIRAAKKAILHQHTVEKHDDTILTSFCPNFLLKQLSKKESLIPRTFFGKGACLIADISGFVKLCGRLSALGVNGIDDLRKCTNSFIGDLVETVYDNGGDVVSFAGDAIICVFMSSSNSNGESFCCRNAMLCAVEIKNFVSNDLSCHVAVSYGDICFAVLGGHNNKWTYLINGDCLTELSEAIDDAGSKEAVATARCYETANFRSVDVSVEPVLGKESVYIREVFVKHAPQKCGRQSRIELAPSVSDAKVFIPPLVCGSVAAGSFDGLSELRQVTTMFLKLDSYCRIKHRDLLSLQPFYVGAQKLIEDSGGFMRQFLVDDKGCVLIAIWGVPGNNHPNDCFRALHCGVSIFQFGKSIDHCCSIGIATGDAYCGTVGSEVRQDYVAMGDSVNLAARLMGKANGRVLMDELSFSELPVSMSVILDKGEALVLKGRTAPLTPFVYSGACLPPLIEADNQGPDEHLLVDRDTIVSIHQEIAALASVEETLFQLADFCENDPMQDAPHLQFYPHVRAIMLVGNAGSGKGYAVALFNRLSLQQNFRHISFRVNQSDGTIPYSTIRKLFLHLVGPANFDKEEKQREVISRLMKDCYPKVDLFQAYWKHFAKLKFVLNLEWNVEGTAHDSVSRAYEFIDDHTLQTVLLCLFKKRITTLVIEDVNFCDQLSWRELVAILDTKAPVLVLFTGASAQPVHERRRKHPSFHFSPKCSPANSPHGTKRSKKGLVQVAVSNASRSQSKTKVYEGLSELDDGSFRESVTREKSVDRDTIPVLTAEVLLTKEQKDFSCFQKHENCLYIKMPLLGEWVVSNILNSALGQDNVSVNLISEVLDLSGGSIYWCQAIAKYIKLIGTEKFSEEVVTFSDRGVPVSPNSKSNTMRRLERYMVYHLESLSVQLQSIAKYASVIGEEFHVSVLFEILPKKLCTSLHELGQCINTLSSECILDLVDLDANVYSFQNDLIRKKLMEIILPTDANVIHQNVAHAYEKLFDDDLRPHYASLSYHYAMSPPSERGNAFKYTINAADQQIGIGNFHAGGLYLGYASSFVKYDAEMLMLSKVTETALFDIRKQKRGRILGITRNISDGDVGHFEDMCETFNLAILNSSFQGVEILPLAEKPSVKNTTTSEKKIRRKSADEAIFMRVPSYSAEQQTVRSRQSSLGLSSRHCGSPCCTIS